MSCGAASAANVARALGQSRTEPEMASLKGTTQAGSSAAQLASGLLAVGISCVPVEAITRREVGAPALLFVDHPQGGPESHAVAVIEREGRLEVRDPLYGRSGPMDDELSAIWRGRALRCAP